MNVVIDNEIIISNPSQELIDWCKENLIFSNPDYAKKARMGLYLGKTPKTLRLYKTDGENLILPYGLYPEIKSFIQETDKVVEKFESHKKLNYLYFIPLRDYQALAVEELYKKGLGILQSKAGSGKTQIGLALAMKYQTKTLWITHTRDLLKQSYDRAKECMNEKLLGTITEGKIAIGEVITFATVQTLCKVNLLLYQNTWDVIIVDECHRVATSCDSVTQFQKVLEVLSAKHKFGLSATVHRADGLIKTTYALLGNISYIVPDEAVKDWVMPVTIKPILTDLKMNFQPGDPYMNSDGTINFAGLTSYIANDTERNYQIIRQLQSNSNHFNLILSDRLEQLRFLKSYFSDDDSAFITGKMTSKKGKELREQALNDLRSGKKHYLFATYKLAKEGLDIPRLDRLYLVTPQKDTAIITQSIGRIARIFDGKDNPICYDFIDRSKISYNYWKERVRTYKKEKCNILE